MTGIDSELDWTKFDKYTEYDCTCHCGEHYKSHARYVGIQGLVARKPCPKCGKVTDLTGLHLDQETLLGKPEKTT